MSLTAISDSGPVMTAQVQVQCGKSRPKDTKDLKDGRKEVKERGKEYFKEKDFKDRIKDVGEKDWPDKRTEKPETDKHTAYDKPWDEKFVDTKLTDGGFDRPYGDVDRPYGASTAGSAALEARVAALEAALFGGAEPFIGADLRPDLRDSALADEADVAHRVRCPTSAASTASHPRPADHGVLLILADRHDTVAAGSRGLRRGGGRRMEVVVPARSRHGELDPYRAGRRGAVTTRVRTADGLTADLAASPAC